MFIPSEMIRKKRDGISLSEQELNHFLHGFLEGQVSDYQMSAFLMAGYINGFEDDEAASLTSIMMKSGHCFSWSDMDAPIVDKHSTGGVGDKASMIILPLLLCENMKVPMIAGRGLGHTGGTLDKLEAIEGVKVFFEKNEITDMMHKSGGLIMGQTEDIVPLDRHLYAMRDVTATVESIPLITASILSKKLAAGVKNLVMDVKVGNGAFMDSIEKARELSRSLIRVGEINHLKVTCILSSMNQILGRNAGNALEIMECMDVLKGEGPKDTLELSVELTAHGIKLAQPNRDIQEIKEACHGHIKSGQALQKFIEVMTEQGATLSNKALVYRKVSDRDIMTTKVFPSGEGFIQSMNTRKLGLGLVHLGAGRKQNTDPIHPNVGYENVIKIGEKVDKMTPLLTIHHDQPLEDHYTGFIKSCFELSDKPTKKDELVLEYIAES